MHPHDALINARKPSPQKVFNHLLTLPCGKVFWQKHGGQRISVWFLADAYTASSYDPTYEGQLVLCCIPGAVRFHRDRGFLKRSRESASYCENYWGCRI